MKKLDPRRKTERSKYPIPILTWQQAIDVSKIDKIELKNFVPNYFSDQPKWFALKIVVIQ